MSQPCAGTIHQHDAHVGQKHATDGNVKTKLVPDLLFGELCHVTSSLAFPLSACVVSSNQERNPSARLFCLRQHQLFHT